jgi:hypothetical protein
VASDGYGLGMGTNSKEYVGLCCTVAGAFGLSEITIYSCRLSAINLSDVNFSLF